MNSACYFYPRDGLTIVELLVTLAIISTLLGLTLANIPNWVATTTLSHDRNKFATLIYTARAAAVHLNQHVILCPGNKLGCGPRDSWDQGALVFADTNRNRKYDDGDAFVARIDALQTKVTWRSFRNRKYLKFLPSGTTDWQNGHFKFCSNEVGDSRALQLVLNAAGRLYFSNDEDGDGIHEDVKGKKLVC